MLSMNYFNSTDAPSASNLALISSASALETPSLITLGAPSTTSLASFNPKMCIRDRLSQDLHVQTLMPQLPDQSQPDLHFLFHVLPPVFQLVVFTTSYIEFHI